MPPGNPAGYLNRPRGISDKTLRRQEDRQEERSEKQLARQVGRGQTRGTSPGGGGGPGQSGRSPALGGGVGDTGTEQAPPLADAPAIRPNSRFGQQYVGSFYPDLYENPEVLAGDFLSQNLGVDPLGGSGLTRQYADLAQVMPQLFLLTQGGGGVEGGSLASFLDYANQFLTQYSTPGAGTISPSAIGNIFSAGADSPLGQMLSDPNATPAQLANMVLSLIGSGLATSMAPEFARGITGHAEASAQQWLADQARGGTGSFLDALRQGDFDDLFR